MSDDVADPDDHLYAEMVLKEHAARRPITDEERWAFVRDHLAQVMDPHMDGTYVWRVRSPHGRGGTFTKVIDNMIREQL